MEKKKVKQSIVASALTGSAGIFITKALSLLYVIPYNEIAQDATVFYSYAYTVYDSLLSLCVAGLPYAIATLVAKYAAKDDYSTVLLVKKVSKSLVLVLGAVCCIFMLIFSKALAYQIIPTDLQNEYYIQSTQNVIRIISFALIFVPYLSYFRGFYQGLKELKTYAFTQVFEQIVRITFLLGMSCLCVYVFKMERVWAAYMGIASTSISAIAAIVYYIIYDRRYELDGDTSQPSVYTKFQITYELIKVAIPYIVGAVLLSSSGMFVLLMFSDGLEAYGVEGELITVYQGIINYQGSKLASIPQIFMTGFCLAIIPHITTAVVNLNETEVKKLITKIILLVNYLSLPVICCMVFFSKEVYYVMYGNYYLEVGSNLVAKQLMIQLFGNLYGVLESIMIALQMRKTYLVLDFVRLIFIFAIFKPCLAMFGVNGYFIAKGSEYLFFIVASLFIINYSYKLDFKEIFQKATKSWIGCIPMFIIVAVVNNFTYNIMANSRIVILVITGVICGICAIFYLIITYRNGVVTELFGIEIKRKDINNLIMKILKKNNDD